MDNLDLAKDGLEHSHHAAKEQTDVWSVRAAMLIAALAATAVLAEMSANDAQTGYLGAHIAASDTWNQYQAKSIRRSIYLQSADILAALHVPAAHVATVRKDAARMQSDRNGDGMLQLAERAHGDEAEREHQLHLYNGLERGVRGLQIAVVLTSLCIATRMRGLVIISALLGGASAVYALLVGLGML